MTATTAWNWGRNSSDGDTERSMCSKGGIRNGAKPAIRLKGESSEKKGGTGSSVRPPRVGGGLPLCRCGKDRQPYRVCRRHRRLSAPPPFRQLPGGCNPPLAGSALRTLADYRLASQGCAHHHHAPHRRLHGGPRLGVDPGNRYRLRLFPAWWGKDPRLVS